MLVVMAAAVLVNKNCNIQQCIFIVEIYEGRTESQKQIISRWSKGMNRKTPFSVKSVCTVFACLQNPQPDRCICAAVLEVWKSPLGQTPFQQFVNKDGWLPVLPLSSHSTGCPSDPVLTRTDGRPWGRGGADSRGGVMGWEVQPFVWILSMRTGAMWGCALLCSRVMICFPGPLSCSARGSFWTGWR